MRTSPFAKTLLENKDSVSFYKLQIYEKRTEQKVFFELSCLVEVLFNIVLHVTSSYSTHDKFSFRARKSYKSNFFETGERNRAASIGGDQSTEPEQRYF